MTREPFIAHSELTNEIYIVAGNEKYCVTEQAIKAVTAIKALEQERMIDKSNFSQEQYKTDLQCAYDCGKSVLDKVREQLKSNLRGVEITLEVLVESNPLRPRIEGAKVTLEECLELIDKAESEDT